MNLKDLFLGIFIAMVLMVGFVKYEIKLRMDGETFIHAGMVQLEPGIYAPVYRRVQSSKR